MRGRASRRSVSASVGGRRSVGGMRTGLRAHLSDAEESDETFTSLDARAGSSVGQSSGLIIRQTKVRVLPGPFVVSAHQMRSDGPNDVRPSARPADQGRTARTVWYGSSKGRGPIALHADGRPAVPAGSRERLLGAAGVGELAVG